MSCAHASHSSVRQLEVSLRWMGLARRPHAPLTLHGYVRLDRLLLLGVWMPSTSSRSSEARWPSPSPYSTGHFIVRGLRPRRGVHCGKDTPTSPSPSAL